MRATAAKLALALAQAALLPSCNAVLGLERANEQTPDDTTPDLTTEAVAECGTVKSSCTCEADCAGPRAACLGDSLCRRALYFYALCLGSDCKDNRPEQDCQEMFELEGINNLPVQQLASCMQSCDQAACESAVVSRCERYCSCMTDHCSDTLVGTWGSSDSATCMTRCSEVDARITNCQTTHCENAPRDPRHCSHALPPSGDSPLDLCSFIEEEPPFLCLDGVELGGACDAQRPCCDGLACTNGQCR